MRAVCAACGKGSVPSHCSRCKAVSYCGKQCQTQHWADGHKKACKKLLKERAAAEADWEAYRAKHGGPLRGKKC